MQRRSACRDKRKAVEAKGKGKHKLNGPWFDDECDWFLSRFQDCKEMLVGYEEGTQRTWGNVSVV